MSLNWNNKADEIDWLREEIVHLKRALDEAQSWHTKAGDYAGLLQNHNRLVVDMSKVAERKRIVEYKVDMLNEQLDTAYADLTAARDRIAGLRQANSDLRTENAKRRMENKGLQATLNDAGEELQQRNEEIAALKRSIANPPKYYIHDYSVSLLKDEVASLKKELKFQEEVVRGAEYTDSLLRGHNDSLKKENARLEADNARLGEAAKRATTVREDTGSLRGQLAKVEHDPTLARADIDVYQQIAKQHNKMASAMATENNNLKADLAAERNRQHALWSAEWDAKENALAEEIAELKRANEQDAISVDYLRRDLFNANATIAAVKKAVE